MTNQELSDKLKELLPNMEEATQLIIEEYKASHNLILDKGGYDKMTDTEKRTAIWLDQLIQFVNKVHYIEHPPSDE